MIHDLLREKNEIIDWLQRQHIKNYSLIHDVQYRYMVNINGNLDLKYLQLKKIPIKFNTIKGSFNCSYNHLVTLKGVPTDIQGYFDCSYNKLIDLKYCPQNIFDYFSCTGNQISHIEQQDFPQCSKFYIDKNPLPEILPSCNNKENLSRVLKKLSINKSLRLNQEFSNKVSKYDI